MLIHTFILGDSSWPGPPRIKRAKIGGSGAKSTTVVIEDLSKTRLLEEVAAGVCVCVCVCLSQTRLLEEAAASVCMCVSVSVSVSMSE